MLTTIVYSCKHQPLLGNGTEREPFSPIRPAHFPKAHYEYGDNILTKEGFELGKILFHDPILSIDSTVSCAGCHKQEYAFSDGGIAFSAGVNNGVAQRNSPAIFNMAWSTSFMWDGGVNHIEVSPLAALQSPVEMGEDLNNLIRKLNRHEKYPQLFNKAFGKDTVNVQQLFWALAQYVSNIVSADSKYDKYILGKTSLTEDEAKGLALFRTHCESCHKEPLFTDYSFKNNGLDSEYVADSGRYRITQNEADWGKFKVPTLRNIVLTYPYMHDGRFISLKSVLDHYVNGIHNSQTLASELKQADSSLGIRLSDKEQSQIISFLHTLTDQELLANERLQ